MSRSLAAVLLAAGACAHAPAVDHPARLAAAETAFAAHSVREDMRAAFIAAFADDGVFAPGGHWQVARDWLRERPPPPIVLDWQPRYVEVSASGDLGLSTGPWKITSKTDPAVAPAYGQFVSIWRREGDAWKVAADLGISHPQPALWRDRLHAGTVPAASASMGGSVDGAEAQFARVMRERGARAAYEEFGAADLRLYRNAIAPEASRAAALASTAMADAWAWTVQRSETSHAGDLGYARGLYSRADAPDKPHGNFLRAWRREANGWRIVLDVASPTPT